MQNIELLVAARDRTYQDLIANAPLATKYRRVIRFGELSAVFADLSFDMFVLDPCVVRWEVCNGLFPAAWLSGRPTLLLVDGSDASLERVLEAARVGLSEAIIPSGSRARALIEDRLRAYGEPSGLGLLLARCANAIARLPRRVKAVSVAMHCGGQIPVDVGHLVRLSGASSRRSLDRWIRDAGFQSASAMLAAARVASCLPLIFDRRKTDQDWLSDVGYVNERAMASELRRLTHLSLKIASTCDRLDLVKALVRSSISADFGFD